MALTLDRRRLLTLGAGAGLLAFAPRLTRAEVVTAPPLFADPFTLGVASGDPNADGFALWTRLAPAPLSEDPALVGGMVPVPVAVDWAVAEDERMTRLVRQGSAIAHPELAHSVHVEVGGLRPDRWYWYQFRVGDWLSPLGRTRTTPAIGQPMQRLRLAWTSCQHWEQGYFVPYRQMVADQPDLILFLGDYIYENSSWTWEVRRHDGPEPVTLAQYRNRHALYKTDRDLQAAHAAAPWAVTWDDHEVDNDYAADRPEDDMDPAAFLLRRAAAYQAYFEHMPLRWRARPRAGAMQLYGAIGFGDLGQVLVLDNRQYRSDHPCEIPEDKGGRVLTDCPERLDPERSLLGQRQEQWLLERLRRSPARWNVIAQQTLMAELEQQPGPGEAWWSEGWDGAPRARERLMGWLAEGRIANPVVLGGDVHAFWVTSLKRDFRDPAAAVVASEFVSTSLSAGGPPYEQFSSWLPDNPHIHFFDSRVRGYGFAEVTPEGWLTELKACQDVRDPDSPTGVLGRWRVEAGRPGPVPA